MQPVSSKFNYLIETEVIFKVTGSHRCGKSGNISEMVQARDVITGGH